EVSYLEARGLGPDLERNGSVALGLVGKQMAIAFERPPVGWARDSNSPFDFVVLPGGVPLRRVPEFEVVRQPLLEIHFVSRPALAGIRAGDVRDEVGAHLPDVHRGREGSVDLLTEEHTQRLHHGFRGEHLSGLAVDPDLGSIFGYPDAVGVVALGLP